MSRFLSIEIDADVVGLAREGDAGAHETLYRTYGGAVLGLAQRLLSSPHEAEEVLQETFMEVLRKLGSFRGDAPVGAWIRRIAVNKCLMHLRSSWTRHGVPLDLVPEQAVGGDTLARQRDAETALAALSPTARTVVWLHDVEGYTHREIGELMGRTASFSKSQLARAYTYLQQCLTDDEGNGTCTPASTSC